MEFEFLIKMIVVVLVVLFLFVRSRFTTHYKFTPRLMIKNVIVLILFVLYLGNLFDFAKLNINLYVRIFLGFFIISLGMALFFWAHTELGKNWSPIIEKKFPKSKKLVKTGPYRYVRHPIYTASFVTILGFLILSANWLLIGIPLLILIAFYIYKIPKEEKSLIDNFGQGYKDYMKKTGRLLPKLG